MVIWLFNYSNGDCLRMEVTPKTRQIIENEYDGDVESYLTDYEDNYSFRMKDCYFMVTDDDRQVIDMCI